LLVFAKILYAEPEMREIPMRKINVCFFTILVVTCLVLPNLYTAAGVEAGWVSKADMPTARGYLRLATVDEKIYTMNSGINYENEEYDPQNNTWTTKAPMAVAVTFFAIAVYENKIYCIGGQEDAFRNRATNQVYDPATDTWEIKTSMPTARFGATAQVVDDKIYVIGGAKGLGGKGIEALNLTEVYDPLTDTWTSKSSIPYATPSVSAVFNNKIYLFGSNITQIYDPQSDTWSTGTSPPVTIDMSGYGFAVAATTTGEMAPKRVYIYDGTNMQVYNPYDERWALVDAPPTSRQNAGMIVVDDQIYVIGGISYPFGVASYSVLHKTNEQYTPVDYGASPTPTESPTKVDEFSLVVPIALLVVAVLVVVAGMVYLKHRRR